MHNKVVYRIAAALHRSGFSVLRFNFRGVGKSVGKHDHGHGEREDLRAGIDFMSERCPGAMLWLAGFSFGASVMLNVACQDDRVAAMIAAGLPVSKYDLSGLTRCRIPKLFVQGSRDQFGPVDALTLLFEGSSEPKRLAVIDGADHFFDGKLDQVERAVSEFAAEHAAI
jgi:alpha/beta superfamily hydrolase